MWYIETENKSAAFHFSVEEYIMQHFPSDELVMMVWQTDKCAMLGSNQIAEAEIDMNCAKQAGVEIVRRASGGGTLFTDLGTFLVTVIMPYKDRDDIQWIAQEKLARPIVEALNKMGVLATVKGRNDILVDGKKASGFAQHIRYGSICSHGSLLYNTDLEMLTRILRVDNEKIRSKALRSVRSRVTNVREHMNNPYSTQKFEEVLKKNLFNAQNAHEYVLTTHDLEQIDNIYNKKYGNPSWTIMRSPKFSFHNSKRFPGGKVEVYLNVIKGTITSCSIRGDFLGSIQIRGLEKRIENKIFQYPAINDALDGISMQPYIGSVTKDELLSCIFD